VLQAGAIYSFGVRVSDGQGGVDDEQISVGVAYTTTGLLPPVEVGGVYRAGRTLPVKFKLTGASARARHVVARLYIAPIVNGAVGPESPAHSTDSSVGNLFRREDGDDDDHGRHDGRNDDRHDGRDDDRHGGDGCQFIFNWSTKGLTPGTYRLRIDMGDGVLRTFVITLN